MIKPAAFALAGFASVAISALAHAACDRDAMIVFDGSGSMAESGFNLLDEPRIYSARRAVRDAIPRVAPFRRLGLVIYGPGNQEDCVNVDLRFAPIKNAGTRILAEIDALTPDGKTPLTAAVKRAADVLDYRQKPGVVVLVTDGKETCQGQPCQLAAQLAADGLDLTVHVIGFKVRGEHFDWGKRGDYMQATSVASCMADRTGGRYFSAETAADLAKALMQALGCPNLARR